MDLTFSAAEEAFRAEVRAWLEANVPNPPLPSGDTRDGFAAHLAWERALFDARLAVVSWPAAFGGRDASLWEWLIFEEEYYRAGAPQRVTQNGIFLLAPTVFEFGTVEQQARILPKMAAGEETWAQGWSEPNAGSDLAAIASKAVRDDAAGGWRLRGQKTWTTRGAFCTHLFGLFRTDPDAPRHNGMTYFLVDLTTPGITVRPVERLDGDEGFAEVFFDDAFVPDADVLGARVDAALPRPVPRGRDTVDRVVPRTRRRSASRPDRARSRRARLHRRRRVSMADVLDRHQTG
jgi:alkylation response protein AidB-like acyl-CoA dehydrogenase